MQSHDDGLDQDRPEDLNGQDEPQASRPDHADVQERLARAGIGLDVDTIQRFLAPLVQEQVKATLEEMQLGDLISRSVSASVDQALAPLQQAVAAGGQANGHTNQGPAALPREQAPANRADTMATLMQLLPLITGAGQQQQGAGLDVISKHVAQFSEIAGAVMGPFMSWYDKGQRDAFEGMTVYSKTGGELPWDASRRASMSQDRLPASMPNPMKDHITAAARSIRLTPGQRP